MVKWVQGGDFMSDKTIKILMTGILICLIIIAFKPVPSFQPNSPSSIDVMNGESVVQLGDNRIAILNTNISSGMHGEVFVLRCLSR